MKSVFLFSTKLKVFLIEIPPTVLLVPAIIYNNNVKTLMKLYPLIIALLGIIIFSAVYFFRAVKITNEEIRCVGPFSTRDKALIKQDRALVITILKKRRVRLELFGKNDDGDASYAWLKNEMPVEINLFRAKANGGINVVAKTLRYFEVETNDIEKILTSELVNIEYEKISVSSDYVDKQKSIRIYFKETI